MAKAYVPGFDQDIFISYAQVDNQPLVLNGQEVRWVSHLKDQLQLRVDQKLGRTEATKIWMDLGDLAGNESVTLAIDSAIHKTAALIVVLSDGYLRSEWCIKEMGSFIESANADGRLFVVHLAEIPLDARPEGIRDLIGFNFFDKDLKAELDPYCKEYGIELSNLRGKLASKLIEMQQAPDHVEEAENAASPPRVVFLAESTPDLVDHRKALATYVEKLGYRVLPANLYPRGAQEYEQMLDQDLEQAKLFIQLLGQFCMPRTEDFPEGPEGLQLGRAEAANVPVLRAYQRDTLDLEKITDEVHQSALKASMALDLEEFKASIKEKLEELDLQESKPTAPDTGDKPVLIHARKGDQGAAFHIRDRLHALGLKFEILDEDDSLEKFAKIRDYSGLVLVYGEKSPGKWIKEGMETLGAVRLTKQPLEPACALYFDPPEMRKGLLMSPPPFFRTIDSSSGEPEFQQFIDELRDTAATA